MNGLSKTLLVLTLALALVASPAWAKKGEKDGWLGIYTRTVDDDLVDEYELDTDHGVMVSDVVEDSPADEAGLKEDDVIISFNGKNIYDDDDLVRLVRKAGSGQEVTLTVMRAGRQRDISVVLDSRRSQRFFGQKSRGKIKDMDVFRVITDDRGQARIGVTVMSLSKEAATNLGADGYGVLINEVSEDSPAEEAGLKPGDIIVEVDDEEIHDTGDITDVIGDKDEDETARVVVIRNGDEKSFEVGVQIHSGYSYSFGPRPFSIDIPSIPDLADFEIDLRGLRNLGHDFHWQSNDDDYDDEIEEAMDELREELRELKRELKEMQKDLD